MVRKERLVPRADGLESDWTARASGTATCDDAATPEGDAL